VMNGGIEVLQRQAGAWLELGPVVMGEPHRQIVVHSLEVELMTNNDVLLIRLVGVEFLQALLCSSLYCLPVSARNGGFKACCLVVCTIVLSMFLSSRPTRT
jgi:hypothetical protein